MTEYKVRPEKKITVRKGAVVAAGDYVGTLGSNQLFFADVYSATDTEVWVRITAGPFLGNYAAIEYKDQVFADPTSIPDTPPVTHDIPQVSVLVDGVEKKIVVTADFPLADFVVIVDGETWSKSTAG